METLPFALSYHFRLFDKNITERERERGGFLRAASDVDPSVTCPVGAKRLSRRHQSVRCSCCS